METTLVLPGDLEVRQEGKRRRLRGRFPYNSTAIIRDRGRVRKERFVAYALNFAIQDMSRPIHLLVGHRFDWPLAVRAAAGTTAATAELEIEDKEDGVEFEAEVPDESNLPSYYEDILRMLELGLVGGISPGFAVPPASVVPDAEELVPEPGNPGVMIRVIRQAVLHELSLVTRPAYDASEVALRAEDFGLPERQVRRVPRWL